MLILTLFTQQRQRYTYYNTDCFIRSALKLAHVTEYSAQSAEHCVQQMTAQRANSVHCAWSLRPFQYCAIWQNSSRNSIRKKNSAYPFCQLFAKFSVYKHIATQNILHGSYHILRRLIYIHTYVKCVYTYMSLLYLMMMSLNSEQYNKVIYN